MTFGSLFAGIGGLDLGLERAGMECRWQVEISEFCRKVLAKHWPNVPKHGDIKEIQDGQLERVDLICGGFPCQPFSTAGRRLGKQDERWLWPLFARVIRMVGPRYVLVENVSGLLSGGGFDDVLGWLAESGYDAEWDCIPASALGAPHRRDRVFVVAYSKSESTRGLPIGETQNHTRPELSRKDVSDTHNNNSAMRRERPNTSAEGFGRIGYRVRGEGDAKREISIRGAWEDGKISDTTSLRLQESRLFDGRVGGVWATEPNVGRVAHGIPSRVDRLKALGNAVVPQVAEWIGRRIISLSPP